MTADHFQRPTRRTRAGLLALVLLGAAGAAACGRGDAAAKPAPESAAKGAPAAAGKDSAAAKAGGAHADSAEVVVLDTAGIRLGGIKVSTADTIVTSGLALTGNITYDANRVTYIGARTAGRVLDVGAELGARVSRGTTLARLESPDVGQIRADERQAVALLGIARQNYDRERRLEQQGISSRKELLDAEAELRRNEAALRSARDRLAVLGAGSGGSGGQFSAVAPFSGVVVTRNVSRGQMAEPTDTLFTVADLSQVWIELNIFERDLARVRTGQSVSVTTDAYPGRQFPGRIVYMGAVVDPGTRTVRARVAIPNPDRALKPGMFARAVVQVPGAGPSAVVLPQDAVQEMRDRRVVFVPGARLGEFRPVPVEVGETVDGNRVVIRSGLKPGARVVTEGAFALRSQLLKGEIGEEGE